MTIFRNNDYVNITFSNGREKSIYNISDDEWDFIEENACDEEALIERYLTEEHEEECVKDRISDSEYLVLRGESVYIPSISEISVPKTLVDKFLDAEEKEDYETLNSLLNFWKLLSLNPDSRVRNNLYWFLDRWDVKLTPSGFIRAYRNAVFKNTVEYTLEETKNIINEYYIQKYLRGNVDKELEKKYNDIINKDSSPVFTDQHSYSTTIKLGQPVSIPREECDPEQEHSCSRGLHVAGKCWLSKGYYGDVALEVLVNPADCVAVPTIDEYGKMRVCKYLPIALVDFDDKGEIIEPEYDLSSDILYLKTLKEDREVNNEDNDLFKVINKHYSTREDIYKDILDELS